MFGCLDVWKLGWQVLLGMAESAVARKPEGRTRNRALAALERSKWKGKRQEIVTQKHGQFSRAQGASSGGETWLLSLVLLGASMFLHGGGWPGALKVPACLALFQVPIRSEYGESMTRTASAASTASRVMGRLW
jgi:hypothetical protein